MSNMLNGLLIRCVVMVIGAVPLSLLLHLIDPPPKLGGYVASETQ